MNRYVFRAAVATMVILIAACGGRPTGNQPQTTATPPPSSPPSRGEPLIWYSPSSGQMVALDWSGKHAGQLALSAYNQTPDGSKLSALGGEVYDVTGKLVGHTDLTKGPGPVWADDSNHWCTFVAAGTTYGQEGSQKIWLKDPTGGARVVATYGTVTGNAGPEILACSLSVDRVVVAQRAFAWVTDVSVFKLSTGARVFQHSYPAQEMARVLASRDGMFLVEDRSVSGNTGEPGGGTVIRSLTDGQVLAQFANLSIIGFSWDGSVALTISDTSRTVAAILWRTNVATWSTPYPADWPQGKPLVVSVLGRPDGSDLAVAIYRGSTPSNQGVDLWVVTGQHGRRILSGPIVPGFSTSFF
ncbi:MAG TPA: hypothetical protein VHK65_02605 [Candidatus Dormibacteraeota bacterium]|nr:hypothetical protein [Candidatus Dormibacteraeota bacterium]